MYRLSLLMEPDAGHWTSCEAMFNQSLARQTVALGCLPSTAYVLIHGLWTYAEEVTVDGVCFNPSLIRPDRMPQRKPLPQSFHNWLGERRTTFQRWIADPRETWTWSLIEGHGSDASPATAAPIQPVEVLEAFKKAAQTGSLCVLEGIAQSIVEPVPELLWPSPITLELEQQFHLSRIQSDTANWWLFDAQASVVIEQIAEHMRMAQRQAFNRAVLAPGAPDGRATT